MGFVVPLARVLALVVFAWWVVARWSRTSPQLLVFTFPLLVAGLLWVLSAQIRGLAAGLLLSLSRRVRRGDRIHVGELTGVVRDVGLFRCVLKKADGSLVYIPNHSLLAEVITIERERNSEPVRVTLPLEDADPTLALGRARSLALLCPYRSLGTRVEAELSDHEATLTLRMHAWNENAAALASELLTEGLRREVRALREAATSSVTPST